MGRVFRYKEERFLIFCFYGFAMNGEAESAAFALFALHPDFLIHAVEQFFGDGKA